MKIVIIKKHLSRSYDVLWNILGSKEFCCEQENQNLALWGLHCSGTERKKMYIEIILSSDQPINKNKS